MSKLEEQLADYFGALQRDDDRVEALPPYTLTEPASAPPAPDRRRMALVLVALVVVAALATLGLVRSSEDSAPYVETPADVRPAPPPVPDGWKPVVFRTVQFAVPADWPVFDDITCMDRSAPAVYLALTISSDTTVCTSSYSTPALVVEVYSYGGDAAELGWGEPTDGTMLTGPTRTERSLNGLPAVILITSGGTRSYAVALPDRDVLIQLNLVTASHQALAEAIIETIGTAPTTTPTSAPLPSTSTTTTMPVTSTEIPVTAPSGPAGEGDLDAWCAAIEGFRSSGMTGPQGFPTTEAIPSFRAMVDAAPEQFRPPIRTMLDWLESGAREPWPSEVSAAALQTTQDWAANCSGSSATAAEEQGEPDADRRSE